MVAHNDSSPTLSPGPPVSGGPGRGAMSRAEAADYLAALGHEAAAIARAYGMDLTGSLFASASTATHYER